MYRCRNLVRCASLGLMLLFLGFSWGCANGRSPRATTTVSTLASQPSTVQTVTETTKTTETVQTIRVEIDPALTWTIAPEGDWKSIENPAPIMEQKSKRFIDGNGIAVTEQYLVEPEGDTNDLVVISPVISGLKDVALQTELNERLKATIEAFWHKPLPAWRGIDRRVYDLSAPMNVFVSSSANYSCNHVLSLLCFKIMVYPAFEPNGMQYYLEEMLPITIDLTNGKLIGLNQVFTDGTDYQNLINDAISKELKLMDPEYLLCAPFQGIAPDQPFSLQQDMLVVYMDERNPEFLLEGRPHQFYIPLSTFGNQIAIYDRVNANFAQLYTGEGWRYPVANNIQYQPRETTLTDDATGLTCEVSQPEFTNLPTVLQDKVAAFCGEAALRKQFSEALQLIGNKTRDQTPIFLNVQVQFNAAGYLSLSRELYISLPEKDNLYLSMNQFKTLNLDVETGKELAMKDLYPVSDAWEDAVQKAILAQNVEFAPATVAMFVREAIANNRFTFSDYSMNLYPGYDPTYVLPNYPIWIPYDALPSVRDWMK